MIEWTPLFATRINSVDEQHKKLFAMINSVSKMLETGNAENADLGKATEQLLDYAYEHFVDEERVMARFGVFPKFLARQRMEHQSFIYDANKMQDEMVSDADLAEDFEKVLRFVTSWLVFHTLRTDQQMAMQVAQIKAGKSPEDAYEIAMTSTLNPEIYHRLVDALLELWTDVVERISVLEAALQKESQQASETGSET